MTEAPVTTLVLILRDGEPWQVTPFRDRGEAVAFVDSAGAQWSETYLVDVLAGPRDVVGEERSLAHVRSFAAAPPAGVPPTNWSLGSRWYQWSIVDATYRVVRISPDGKAKLAWEQAEGGPAEQVKEYSFDPKRWTFAGWVAAPAGVPDPVRLRDDAEMHRILIAFHDEMRDLTLTFDDRIQRRKAWLDAIEAHLTSRASTVPDPVEAREKPMMFHGRCPHCDDFPTGEWMDGSDFKAGCCDVTLIANHSMDADGVEHWSFDWGFDDDCCQVCGDEYPEHCECDDPVTTGRAATRASTTRRDGT